MGFGNSAEEVAAEIGSRSRADAAVWFADWLRRRDRLEAELAAEQLAGELEILAVEIRGEARRQLTPLTGGLTLAAAVLLDAAGGARIGDLPSSEQPYGPSATAHEPSSGQDPPVPKALR